MNHLHIAFFDRRFGLGDHEHVGAATRAANRYAVFLYRPLRHFVLQLCYYALLAARGRGRTGQGLHCGWRLGMIRFCLPSVAWVGVSQPQRMCEPLVFARKVSKQI